MLHLGKYLHIAKVVYFIDFIKFIPSKFSNYSELTASYLMLIRPADNGVELKVKLGQNLKEKI